MWESCLLLCDIITENQGKDGMFVDVLLQELPSSAEYKQGVTKKVRK